MKKYFPLLLFFIFFISPPLFSGAERLISDKERQELHENLKDPAAIYLTWKRDPTTTMTVLWISSVEKKDGAVLFKEKSDSTAPFIKVQSESNPVPEDHPFYIHSTELTGLKPDTEYAFHVQGDKNIYSFKTMPKTLEKPLTFIEGGDACQKEMELFEHTNKNAILHKPRFILLGGDLAYAAGESDEKEDFDRWLRWFQIWQETTTVNGLMTPLIVAIGNHEVKGRGGEEHHKHEPEFAPFFYAFFPMPGKQGYNSLQFGNYMNIIILDSDHTHSVAGAQTLWLKEELQRTAGKYLHNFVCYHVAAYPSSRSFMGKTPTAIRRFWVPLFDRYGINIVFEHHDHRYKRTYPLTNSKVDPKGIVYMGDGSWGVHSKDPKYPNEPHWFAKSITIRQFLQVTITPTSRTIETYSADTNHLIDTFSEKVSEELLYARASN